MSKDTVHLCFDWETPCLCGVDPKTVRTLQVATFRATHATVDQKPPDDICPECLTRFWQVRYDPKLVHSEDQPQQPDTESEPTGAEKMVKTGEAMQKIGCVLTIFVTIPIILIAFVLC